ncbi:MAG: NAD-dependent epimerase/dehydratase family protein, partial [Chloroflexota bacterium]
GRRAVIELVEGGHKVTVFHRGVTNNPLPDEVEHIHGDMENIDEFEEQFTELAPEVVVHMRLMEQGESTQMMRLFRDIADRVVVASSADVYRAWGRLLNTEPGTPEPLPLSEISPLREQRYPYRNNVNKDWRYYYDKIHVEQVAMKMRKPPASVLRMPMVYGEYDYQRRVAGYLQRMLDGREFILLDERVANWKAPRAYVDNIAHALALITTNEAAEGRIYHLAEPHEAALTESEWVYAIGRAAGWGGRVLALPPDKLPRHRRMDTHAQSITLDSSRIRGELDFNEIVPFEEGVRRTVAWDREHVIPKMDPVDYSGEDKVIATLGL